MYILDKLEFIKHGHGHLTLWVRNSHMLWAGRYE